MVQKNNLLFENDVGEYLSHIAKALIDFKVFHTLFLKTDGIVRKTVGAKAIIAPLLREPYTPLSWAKIIKSLLGNGNILGNTRFPGIS